MRTLYEPTVQVMQDRFVRNLVACDLDDVTLLGVPVVYKRFCYNFKAEKVGSLSKSKDKLLPLMFGVMQMIAYALKTGYLAGLDDNDVIGNYSDMTDGVKTVIYRDVIIPHHVLLEWLGGGLISDQFRTEILTNHVRVYAGGAWDSTQAHFYTEPSFSSQLEHFVKLSEDDDLIDGVFLRDLQRFAGQLHKRFGKTESDIEVIKQLIYSHVMFHTWLNREALKTLMKILKIDYSLAPAIDQHFTLVGATEFSAVL